MDALEQRLRQHTTIGIDTSIFIYQVEAHPRYLPVAQVVLNTVQKGQVEAVTSVITLMELTVHPWRQQQPVVARQYEALLVHFPHLHLAEVTRDIIRQAAQLRARHNLGAADALQVATTLHYGGTALVTNDSRLARLAGRLDIVLLDEFV
jgi:predicted nucleic acid-binding protein